MKYLFKCPTHGQFEVSQPMLSEHVADCPECHMKAQRVYTVMSLTWSARCWDFDNDGLGDNLVLKHH